MRVLVLGAGLMGAQIGCEYALGGHDVTLVARDLDRVRQRVDATLEIAEDRGLSSAEEVAGARDRIAIPADHDTVGWDLVVESVPEDLELKASVLRPVAEGSPDAILASNASSLSITDLGRWTGVPERTLGTHYWNPPLLMPLVEVVPGLASREVVERIVSVLTDLGKRPVVVDRDVPGFIWNRLQFALLRECVWLVENQVASPETVDTVVREGLARRWRHVGPFQAIALGGVETWNRSGANLVPELSTESRLPDLAGLAPSNGSLEEVAARRDRALARELLEERSE
jgi:3-hydroxyacyl-CoA dehydrogenase